MSNKSFEYGIFPSKLKIGKIIPAYKSGDKQLFTNYRPVSLLPQFSKILEKLFNRRLMDLSIKITYFITVNMVFVRICQHL